jgi:hypothetical protein
MGGVCTFLFLAICLQVGSLMGGYIYLRFFNPVIVTPDALNFISKPSRVMRRNLILVRTVCTTSVSCSVSSHFNARLCMLAEVRNKVWLVCARAFLLHIQVAKVLQTLSNGLLFGDKEQFMKVLAVSASMQPRVYVYLLATSSCLRA